MCAPYFTAVHAIVVGDIFNPCYLSAERLVHICFCSYKSLLSCFVQKMKEIFVVHFTVLVVTQPLADFQNALLFV